MKLLPGWYVIACSKELKVGEPLSIKRFGQELVLWRDLNGKPVLMKDQCPHRSAKLSDGDVSDGQIICPFHGFRYSTTGQCSFVPETGKSASNLQVSCFDCVEKNDFIWLWHGEPATSSTELPWFSELDNRYAYSQIEQNWSCHFSRCVENQLDYAHLPYVHRTTIGRFGFDPRVKVDFELSTERIKFTPTGKAFIEFLFPNIWRNYINSDFQLVLAFAPVSEEETKLYLRAYFKHLNFPVVRSIAGVFFNITNTIILNQDKSVVLNQRPIDSLNEEELEENLFPSDRAIKHFRDVFKQV